MMKINNRFFDYPFILLGLILTFTNSCEKDKNVTKKNPVITWENPSDIAIGTPLNATQLNATADVPGTFNYTPAIGTVLSLGANQDLKVDFTPTDAATYNVASKTVKINVRQPLSIAVFNTLKTYGTMTDQVGNPYKTITIGTQTWMAENLRTTKFNNGTVIPLVNDNTAWAILTNPAYSWYNNDEVTYKNTYGALYNWYTVNTGNLCPTGWHVPSDAEWIELTNFLGGTDVASGKLKETGTTHWNTPNTGATNETGFTALPGCIRFDDGRFDYRVGSSGYWWSATEIGAEYARCRIMLNNDIFFLGSSYNKEDGLSVRCVKD